MAESPKFSRLKGIGVEEHDGDVRFYTGSGNTAVSRMHNEKYAIQYSFMEESPKFLLFKGNRGREQILERKWKYGACAIKSTKCNAYLWPNRRNFRVCKEIGVEEHDGDVRC